ncbi:type I restriction enzyme S subunit [Vibrio crassostreae]|uniref:restriction endonuclease subunit S n=1 Tax=Vibrio crassostreae TaxID=246167 RepID=UPI00119BB38E|nr:restriction endonuclease subunit S [Vibrio crassostreae]TWD72668.1 type I restriction enzyme S subunit [Vibrio crassostreae]
MSKLTKHRFSDLYSMSSGISSTKEQAGHGAPFLSFSAVFHNSFLPDELIDLMDATVKQQETYSIKKGDIFLTRTSEVVDELAMSSVATKDYPSATYSGFLKRLRPTQSDVSYHKFMAFYLRSSLFRKTMTNNAVMTLRASLNEDIFSYLELLLPEFDTQVKVGDLLYVINQKIELNKRIITELEAMAKTLFDYWFIQFDFPDTDGNPYKTFGGKMIYNSALKREIPEGWGDSTLGDIAELYQPKTISEKEMNKDGLYLVYGANGVVGRYDFYNHESSVVAVTCRGNSCGQINITRPYSWITGNAMVVNPKSSLPTAYLRHLLNISGLENVITGSAQPQITRANLAPMKVIAPHIKVLEEYTDFVKSNFDKQLAVLDENEQLMKLRDWLLPMLMNGQVTIK